VSDASSLTSSQRKALRRDARAAFLLDRVTEDIRAGERPTDVEREDLDRRLLAAVDALGPEWKEALASTASENTLISKSLRRLRNATNPTEIVTAEHRAALALVWPTVRTAWRAQNAELLAARAILWREASNGDLMASEPDAEHRLEQSVREMLPLARQAVRVPPVEELSSLGERDGIFALDADFGSFVLGLPFQNARSIAEEFKAARRNLRTDGEPPWKDWADPIVLPRVLARVLWKILVRPALDGRSTEMPPVVAFQVAHELTDTCWAPGRQLTLFDNRAILKSASAEELAEVPIIDPEDFELMQRGVERLRSLTGQRVIRHLARSAYEINLANPGQADVIIEGGFSGFAELLGEHSKRAPEFVRDVLRAGQEFRRRWLNGSELAGLWMYRNTIHETRGRRAELVITVGTVLRPYYTLRHLPKDQRFGVPVLPMPPFCGRERDWAGQAVFQFLLEAELVARRMDLATDGGALLLAADFERLAARAGMPAGSWRKVIARWTQDGDDGPAMLELVAKDRYVIADRAPYKAAREWLLEGARRSLQGRQRGERRAAQRRHPHPPKA